MSKRSRALYEADLQAQQAPFVVFGTPLPPLDPAVRDDGAYVPVWKQDVRDEHGRRRLHGAFTGGWSAGYYNTVGSKEGWTPATFVSSRTNRHKDRADQAASRPEDYMDEEDLADAEEARKIQTSQAFAGLGLTADDASRPAGGGSGGALAGLFRVTGETMGTRLLKKMGWKEGQGIGPKVRRAAQLGVGAPATAGADRRSLFLFAPDDVVVIRMARKTDRKGLGFEGAERLSSSLFSSSRAAKSGHGADESDDSGGGGGGVDDDESGITRGLFGRPKAAASTTSKKKAKAARGGGGGGGFGLGVLNDTGSDDDDPYDMGPRISFNRVLGGDKKKRTKSKPPSSGRADAAGEGGGVSAQAKARPLFSKTSGLVGSGGALSSSSRARTCHDGRPPLAGFVLGRHRDALTSDTNASSRFPPPVIPPGWTSTKQRPAADARTATGTTSATSATGATGSSDGYVSTADAAKASKMDPAARAAVLGEGQLPGKSVFDFLSKAARDRIAAATGKTDLPEARGEIPAAYALSAAEKHEQLLRAVPRLDKATAVAAITRGARGGGPYQDDAARRSRYRAYLEHEAGIARALPPKAPHVADDDWLRELHEFSECARIFKPMSGLMASRFTTAASVGAAAPSGASNKAASDTTQGPAEGGPAASLVTRPAPKPQDPAEAAAQMGMYGPMTRTVADFAPTRLLCKRMGVRAPAIVQPDTDAPWRTPAASKPPYGRAAAATGPGAYPGGNAGPATSGGPVPGAPMAGGSSATQATVQTDRNDALEGQRAGEDVFRAVFGDSDDDDDNDD